MKIFFLLVKFFLFAKIILHLRNYDNNEKNKIFIIFDYKFYSVSKYLKPEKRERGARKVIFKKRRANEKYFVMKIFIKTVINAYWKNIINKLISWKKFPIYSENITKCSIQNNF